MNGCYDGRPPSETIAVADSVLAIAEERATAASCGLLAGRAQALSLAGEHAEAITTVQRLAAMVERLPSSVIDDTDSLWGWPEHRLRHTEAWVYAHAGYLRETTRAQEQAIRLSIPPRCLDSERKFSCITLQRSFAEVTYRAD